MGSGGKVKLPHISTGGKKGFQVDFGDMITTSNIPGIKLGDVGRELKKPYDMITGETARQAKAEQQKVDKQQKAQQRDMMRKMESEKQTSEARENRRKKRQQLIAAQQERLGQAGTITTGDAQGASNLGGGKGKGLLGL